MNNLESARWKVLSEVDFLGSHVENFASATARELSSLLYIAVREGIAIPAGLLVRLVGLIVVVLASVSVLAVDEFEDLREAWANYQDARSALRL